MSIPGDPAAFGPGVGAAGAPVGVGVLPGAGGAGAWAPGGGGVALRSPSPLPPSGAPSGSSSGSSGPSGGGSSGSGSSGSPSGSPGGSAPSGGRDQEDNPFAPPPEGAPDRPWQPRTPPPSGPPPGQGPGGQRPRSPWGQQGQQEPRGPRFDASDPAQRRARYALISGMWAFFFVIFSVPYLALLLGALAVYWGASALRTRPRTRPDAPAPGGPGTRPQFPAALSGLVSGGLSLAMVFGLFSLQIVYRDYFECVSDSLTTVARADCDKEIPAWVERVVGEDE
ncbi:hypothetical protein [Streptomyces capparidis]